MNFEDRRWSDSCRIANASAPSGAALRLVDEEALTSNCKMKETWTGFESVISLHSDRRYHHTVPNRLFWMKGMLELVKDEASIRSDRQVQPSEIFR